MAKKVDKKEIVSAYETEGKRRNQKEEITKGFKVFVVILYVLGFFAAFAIIVLLTKCQS